MSRDLSDLRILLVQEWLYTWAGSERVLDELADMMPHADILAGIVTPEMRAAHPVAARAKETWLAGVRGARSNHRWFLPLQALAFSTFDTSGYDVIISVSHSFGKLVRPRNGAVHFCYCLTPPRYLWDLRGAHDDLATTPQRLALRFGGPVLRAVDRRGAAHVHQFGSISRHVADRVRRSYRRDSSVIYPPVRPKAVVAAAPQNGGPFLLSLGRLVPYKRVDLAIRAAETLKMRLVVAGDGPERTRLEQLAGKYTEFVGQVSEEAAARLLAECAAFVFCAEEDFGIAPVEANAHGRPVVAYRRGGATETLVDGETAVFFDRQDESGVVAAIDRCLNTAWDSARIEQNARRFAPDHFRREMSAAVERLVDGPR